MAWESRTLEFRPCQPVTDPHHFGDQGLYQRLEPDARTGKVFGGGRVRRSQLRTPGFHTSPISQD